MSHPIACLIYDFDKTLSPRNMQEFSFLPEIDMPSGEFWEECRRFSVENGADAVLTYMYKMLEKSRAAGKPITRDRLRRLGEKIEFYPGVVDWFARINRLGRGLGIDVEHYIISSGLQEIIEGSRVSRAFRAVFAASYCYGADGTAFWPSTAVNYTSKTQYLFRINKGILDVTNDRDLNAYTPEYMRRIPFSNMIYIADGLTDVPCMKMTKQKGGFSIAVHPPGETAMADDMLLQGRADFSVETDYSQGSELEKVVTMLMRRIRSSSDVAMAHARQVQRAHERRGEQVPLNIPMRGSMDFTEDME